MEILSCKPITAGLSITGNDLSGTFITQTQYGYQLTPNHPVDKSYFIIYSDTLFDLLNGNKIKFKAEVRFNFDTEGSKPSIEWLTEMIYTANTLMNKMLDLEIQEKTNLNTITIAPVSEEEAHLAAKEALLVAYPDN